MPYIKCIILLWILVVTSPIRAQDWSQDKHKRYLDSLMEIRTQLDAQNYNTLLYRGLAKGGDLYSEQHLDYLFGLANNHFRQGARDSMGSYLDKAYEVIQSTGSEQIWRWHLNKGNYYFDIPDVATAKSHYLKSIAERPRLT